MTTLSKTLFTMAVIGLAGGSLLDAYGVKANPALAAVLPFGAIATGMFLIVYMMEREMAKYDKEQAENIQRLERHTAASASSTPTPAGDTVGTLLREAVSSTDLKNILVPIDFSDGSKKTLQYAIHFAKQLYARIILLHVLPAVPDLSDNPESGPFPNEELQNGAAKRLKAWVDEFVPHDIPTLMQFGVGPEAIEIVEHAKSFEVDLMIISTHGRTGRAHALAGSLAENLVQLAPCPVLVVREKEHDFIKPDNAKWDIKNPIQVAALKL